jgi:hypothetical protein
MSRLFTFMTPRIIINSTIIVPHSTRGKHNLWGGNSNRIVSTPRWIHLVVQTFLSPGGLQLYDY